MHEVSLPVTGRLSDGSTVTLSAFEPGHLTQIAGWSGFARIAQEALASLGLTLPKSYDRAGIAEDVRIWRIAPDRALIRSSGPIAVAGSDDMAVLDLSDAKAGLRVAGDGAAALLARLVAVNVDAKAFPPGCFIQAPIHQIAVLIERQSPDVFDLLIPTTWTHSLIGLMAAHVSSPGT